MLKRYLYIATLAFLVGCNSEREVDIATPEEIYQKDLLVIFPSIPEEFCYADKMTEIFNDFGDELKLRDIQMLSVDTPVDCYSYGFTDCESVIIDPEKNSGAIECLSDQDDGRACLYMLGVEYKDSQGDLFEDSCIMGADRR